MSSLLQYISDCSIRVYRGFCNIFDCPNFSASSILQIIFHILNIQIESKFLRGQLMHNCIMKFAQVHNWIPFTVQTMVHEG